jgi:hypothetical protein
MRNLKVFNQRLKMCFLHSTIFYTNSLQGTGCIKQTMVYIETGSTVDSKSCQPVSAWQGN